MQESWSSLISSYSSSEKSRYDLICIMSGKVSDQNFAINIRVFFDNDFLRLYLDPSMLTDLKYFIALKSSRSHYFNVTLFLPFNSSIPFAEDVLTLS